MKVGTRIFVLTFSCVLQDELEEEEEEEPLFEDQNTGEQHFPVQVAKRGRGGATSSSRGGAGGGRRRNVAVVSSFLLS